MATKMKFSAILQKEGDWYVSLCPELDIASQGKTVEEAVNNLQEAVELYLEDEDVKLPDAVPIVTMFEVSHGKTSPSISA